MDKKKIKKLITETKSSILRDLTKIIGTDGEIYKDIASDLKTLDIVLAELSKSDWVSVEDELPPYCKNVLVIAGNYNVATYVTCRVRSHRSNELDKNNFIKQFPFIGMDITHWKSIEKLEE